jgi:hypothetical protein
MRLLRLAALITLVSACSSQPQRVPAPPAVTGSRAVQSGTGQVATSSQLSPAANQAQAQTQTQTGAPAASPAAGAAPKLAVDPDLVKRGYSPAIYNGQRVYCRTETVTGSRFTQKVCMTAERIKEAEKLGKDFMNAPRTDTECAVTKCN